MEETSEEREDFKKFCSFRELFSGRFSQEEAAIIITLCDNDVRQAVNYVLTTPPEEIRRRVQLEEGGWTTVERKIRRVRGERSVLDRARLGKVDTESRMFSCAPCDNVWWRKTPGRKQVSKCNRCRQRYDPLSRDKEWGWAEFNCPHCHRSFNGYCAMWQTAPCFNCHYHQVPPTRIIPPGTQGRGRSGFTHRCNAPGCAGNRRAPPVVNDEEACVHPSSRAMRQLPKVVKRSEEHISSGSTVDTFLTQSGMERNQEDFFPSLPAVSERDED